MMNDREWFEQALRAIREHPAWTGDVWTTANVIERLEADTWANYALSQGLREGWIEEVAE